MSRENSKLMALDFWVSVPGQRFHLALNVQKLRKVLEPAQMTPLPRHYRPVVGLLDVGGEPVSVLDLSLCVAPEGYVAPADASDASARRILIVETQGMPLGLMIHSTGKIQGYPSSDFHPNPAVVEKIKKGCCLGSLKLGEEFVQMLDIDGLLEAEGLGPEKVTQAPKSLESLAGKQILIVDDSKLFQKKIQKILEKTGAHLTFADNGADALNALAARKFQFDLVFSDIEMPIMDGIEFARRLSEEPKAQGLPLLFNSSLSNPVLIQELKELMPGAEYLVKFDEALILRSAEALVKKAASPGVNYG